MYILPTSTGHEQYFFDVLGQIIFVWKISQRWSYLKETITQAIPNCSCKSVAPGMKIWGWTTWELHACTVPFAFHGKKKKTCNLRRTKYALVFDLSTSFTYQFCGELIAPFISLGNYLLMFSLHLLQTFS